MIFDSKMVVSVTAIVGVILGLKVDRLLRSGRVPESLRSLYTIGE